jgi:NTE family protein
MTTAWILPGGSSFGAVQVGQLEALVHAGLAPDLLFGTSAGSLNALWMATFPDAGGVASLRDLWLGVKREEIFPFRPWTVIAGLAGMRDHTVSRGAFTRWLRTHAPLAHLEDTSVPLTVTATDLDTGEPVYMREGEAVPALLASTALPGVFPPVELGGRWLVDGGLVANTPIDQAVAAGADRVYILPTIGEAPGDGNDKGTERPARRGGALDVLLRSSALVLGHAADTDIAAWAGRCEVFVLPAPSVAGLSPFSFKAGARLMAEARDGASRWLPTARPVPAARVDDDPGVAVPTPPR